MVHARRRIWDPEAALNLGLLDISPWSGRGQEWRGMPSTGFVARLTRNLQTHGCPCVLNMPLVSACLRIHSKP